MFRSAGSGRQPLRRRYAPQAESGAHGQAAPRSAGAGRLGELIEDDGTEQPFQVEFDDEETWWFYEDEVEVSDFLTFGGEEDGPEPAGDVPVV